MRRIRQGGPKGVVRPFSPTLDPQGTQEANDKIAEALEHIARALSSIDHNLEFLIKQTVKGG